MLLVALAGGLLWYAFSPDWRVLYAGMDPDDARQTGLVLAQAQIPFEPTPDGTGIRVPAAQLDKARLATAAKGVKSGRMGFEIFDKPNWVGSEFDEQVSRAGGAEFVSSTLQRGEWEFHEFSRESRKDGARTFLLQEPIAPEGKPRKSLRRLGAESKQGTQKGSGWSR
jgi:hypothetical protein